MSVSLEIWPSSGLLGADMKNMIAGLMFSTLASNNVNIEMIVGTYSHSISSCWRITLACHGCQRCKRNQHLLRC